MICAKDSSPLGGVQLRIASWIDCRMAPHASWKDVEAVSETQLLQPTGNGYALVYHFFLSNAIGLREVY